jgi:hypothetical protein
MSLAVINLNPIKVEETPTIKLSKAPHTHKAPSFHLLTPSPKPSGSIKPKMDDFNIYDSHGVLIDKINHTVEGVGETFDLCNKYREYIADSRQLTIARFEVKLVKAIKPA